MFGDNVPEAILEDGNARPYKKPFDGETRPWHLLHRRSYNDAKFDSAHKTVETFTYLTARGDSADRKAWVNLPAFKSYALIVSIE